MKGKSLRWNGLFPGDPGWLRLKLRPVQQRLADFHTRNSLQQPKYFRLGKTGCMLGSGREPVMARISLKVNGRSRVVDADPSTPMLYVLRDELGLNGPKFGCGLSQCGCCTVIVDGNAVRSCSMAVSNAQNRSITTLEGLGSVAQPHRLQKAFIDEQAAQCGYCMNGMIMNAKVLLDKNPHPTEAEIRRALDGILCRCGSHLRVLKAIQRATV